MRRSRAPRLRAARLDEPTSRTMLTVLAAIYAWMTNRVPRQDVDDLYQEVANAGIEDIDNYRADRGELSGWIWGIAKHTVARYLRRRLRLVNDSAYINSVPDPRPNADARMSHRELYLELINGIHPSRRGIFQEHHIDGKSFEELAEKYGISSDAARKRCQRAREELEAAWIAHREEQRKLGAIILPIAVSAWLDTERAHRAHAAKGMLDRIGKAIERWVHDDAPPPSQERPTSREYSDTDPVEAHAPVALPAPLLPWLGPFGAALGTLGGIVAVVLAMLLRPGDKPSILADAESGIHIPEDTPVAVGVRMRRGPGAALQELATRAAAPGRSEPIAAPVPRKRPLEPMAHVLLFSAQKAADRHDVARARELLGADGVRDPADPLSANAAKLRRRIAALAERTDR